MKFFFILSLCLIFFSYSLFIGEIHFTLNDLGLILSGKGSTLQQYIFFHLRLPHTLNAFVIGCLLALSGYLMQIMLANPLADPYTLGTTGGACVFTLLGMIMGWDGSLLVGCSFVGSLVSILLLALAVGDLRRVATSQLLLVGIIFAAGWGAILSLLLIMMPPLQTRSILYWLFGDIDNQQYPFFTAGCLILGLICSLLMRKQLHVLSQGVTLARTLGLDTDTLQLKLILLSSLMTAAAVSIGGTIGFIGFVVPHLARMLLKSTQLLLPCTLFLGGCLLLLADIFSRVIMAPEQLPIGILTTLIGIPLFIYLSRDHRHA